MRGITRLIKVRGSPCACALAVNAFTYHEKRRIRKISVTNVTYFYLMEKEIKKKMELGRVFCLFQRNMTTRGKKTYKNETKNIEISAYYFDNDSSEVIHLTEHLYQLYRLHESDGTEAYGCHKRIAQMVG